MRQIYYAKECFGESQIKHFFRGFGTQRNEKRPVIDGSFFLNNPR